MKRMQLVLMKSPDNHDELTYVLMSGDTSAEGGHLRQYSSQDESLNDFDTRETTAGQTFAALVEEKQTETLFLKRDDGDRN